MCSRLPEEVIAHILSFLNVSDRKAASLVSRRWYNASRYPQLMSQVIFKLDASPNSVQLLDSGLDWQRTIVKASFSNVKISSWELVAFLKRAASLCSLDLSGCNDLFMTNSLLNDPDDIFELGETLGRLTELNLSNIVHLTDSLFNRLAEACQNLTSLNLSGCPILFFTDLVLKPGQSAVLTFNNIINFVKCRALKLKVLNFSSTGITDKSLCILTEVDNLQLDVVYLEKCRELSDKGIFSLCEHQKTLKEISMAHLDSITPYAIEQVAVKLPHLKGLNIRKCVRLADQITPLKLLKDLTSLNMSECLSLSASSLIQLFSSENLCRLQTLCLGACTNVTDNVVKVIAQCCPGLEHLDLSSCFKITDHSLYQIITRLKRLQYLNLAWCKSISDYGLLGLSNMNTKGEECPAAPCVHMRREMFPEYKKSVDPGSKGYSPPQESDFMENYASSGDDRTDISSLSDLRFLDLSDCPNVSNVSVVYAFSFPHLQTLKISRARRISDQSLISLSKRSHNLECLHVAMSAITDRGISKLVHSLQRIKELNVSGCDGLTDLSVELIADRCPQLRYLDVSFCGSISEAVADSAEYRLKSIRTFNRRLIGSNLD